jgi:hypothetical protein
LPRRVKTTIFLAPQGEFFRHLPHHYKEENMADVKVPQRLEPQDIVKLLVALRRALKNGEA